MPSVEEYHRYVIPVLVGVFESDNVKEIPEQTGFDVETVLPGAGAPAQGVEPIIFKQ